MIFGHKLTDGEMMVLEIEIKTAITCKILSYRLYIHEREDLYCLDIVTKNEYVNIRLDPKKYNYKLNLCKVRKQIKCIVERINK